MRGTIRGCDDVQPIRAALRRSAARVVYPSRVSEKPPQTYILHTVALFVVLAIVMVLFLKHHA
jgi:hypothetical protein